MSNYISLCSSCCGLGFQAAVKIIKFLKDNKIECHIKRGHHSQFTDILTKNGIKDFKKDRKNAYIIVKDKVYNTKDINDKTTLEILKIITSA